MTITAHKKLWRFITYLRTSALELTSSLCVLWWTYIVWFPSFHEFATVAAMNRFSVISSVTNRHGMEVFWTVLGLMSIIISIGGLARRDYRARKLGVLLQSTFWATLFVVLWTYHGETGSKGMFAILLLMCLTSHIILGVEQREESR